MGINNGLCAAGFNMLFWGFPVYNISMEANNMVEIKSYKWEKNVYITQLYITTIK